MNFLRAVEFRDDLTPPSGFPFDIPVVETFQRIEFKAPVTFFVGENGCGKSTIMEAIAAGMNVPAIGSADISRDPTLRHATALAQYLTFVKNRAPKYSFFFRAEDAFGFTKRIQSTIEEMTELEEHYNDTLSGYARQLAVGVARGQKSALQARYGEDPDAKSHGEWFIEILKSRLQPGGLYFLDEPETPLSPIHQLSLLSLFKELTSRSTQFVIATHSPILMAFPGADILNFDTTPISPIDWADVEHVAITRAFLKNPQSFLRHL